VNPKHAGLNSNFPSAFSLEQKYQWELLRKEMEDTHSQLWTFKHAIEFKRKQEQLMWEMMKRRRAEETQEDDPIALSLKSQLEGVVKTIDMCTLQRATIDGCTSSCIHVVSWHRLP
jgi:hypothetical protein